MNEDGGMVVSDYTERLYRDANGSFFLFIMNGKGKRLTDDETILWIRNHVSARDSRSLLKEIFPVRSKEKKTGQSRRYSHEEKRRAGSNDRDH
jgi:hypothetical protein